MKISVVLFLSFAALSLVVASCGKVEVNNNISDGSGGSSTGGSTGGGGNTITIQGSGSST